ncbi:MAG: DUF1292 domain-containing protein [Clostridiaceae bacterium]|nr:DUF1292 domain-containing protein [Clostridiaceae bacterium]
MDYENDIIELTGEDGDTIKCEYLDTVLVDDEEYVVLLPLDEHECADADCSECEAEVIIMKIDRNGDEEYLVPVEDEDELDRAFEAFQQQIDEEYDEEDDLD